MNSTDDDRLGPQQAETSVGDGGARHHGPERIRQSAGGPRFHRALSDRGGSARPSRRIPVWPAGNADHQGAAGCADGAGRAALRRRRRWCPPASSAITTALLAVLKAGDHLLVCDNAYRPTRNFCNGLLGPLWRRNKLFRSPDRRRHRRSVQAEHQGGDGRSAWLAILRDAGHSSHRWRRTRSAARW